MIFQNPVHDKIISLLSKGPAKMDQIYQCVQTEISRPNLYKIISQMIENQTLVKQEGTIRLNSTRVLSVMELSRTIKQNYLSSQKTSIALEDKEEKVYTSDTLYKLDSIRGDLLQQINKKYAYKEPNYFYNAHTYHIIWMPETEETIHRAIGEQWPDAYFLVGNNTELDTYGANLLKMIPWYHLAYMNKPSFMSEWYLLNVVGDYYIEVILPEVIAKHFALIFSSVQDIDTFHIAPFIDLFHLKADYSLKIRRDSQNADHLRSKIGYFFKNHK